MPACRRAAIDPWLSPDYAPHFRSERKLEIGWMVWSIRNDSYLATSGVEKPLRITPQVCALGRMNFKERSLQNYD